MYTKPLTLPLSHGDIEHLLIPFAPNLFTYWIHLTHPFNEYFFYTLGANLYAEYFTCTVSFNPYNVLNYYHYFSDEETGKLGLPAILVCPPLRSSQDMELAVLLPGQS